MPERQGVPVPAEAVEGELIVGLLSEEEFVALVGRIRRAVDPETLGKAVADLFHAGIPRVEARCRDRLLGDEAVEVVVDFLASWRFCPVSRAAEPSRACLEDAAKQLVAAIRKEDRDG